MSLASSYAGHVRRELNYHPVWTPGIAVAPGDVGRMLNGYFVREGTLAGIVSGMTFDVVEDPTAEHFKFDSGVTIDVGIEGGTPVNPALSVKGEAKFSGSSAAAFEAREVLHRSIADVRSVLGAMPWRDLDWDRGTVMVSAVYAAGSVGILLAESSQGSVEVSGSAEALRTLAIADASVSFGGSSGASFAARLTPEDGPHPILLRLYRKKMFKEGLTSFGSGGDAPDLPYEEVSPREDPPGAQP